MRVVAICSVVAVIGMFFYLIAESKMLSYMSSDPEVCITCHTMNTHYATWQHSSHRERATCVDCHLPRDSFMNKMLAKARDGYNHSLAMTFKTYGYNLRITDDAASRIQDNCISCHDALSRKCWIMPSCTARRQAMYRWVENAGIVIAKCHMA